MKAFSVILTAFAYANYKKAKAKYESLKAEYDAILANIDNGNIVNYQ